MSILSYCITDWLDSTMEDKCLFAPMYLILLSNLSYCTMDRMDGTMKSKCPFRSTLSYCPSHPIVPWTGWTVRWNPSVHSDLPCPTVHPILLYHGQYDGIQVSIQIYLMLLSIPSYCAMDRMDGMMESKCPFRSHPIILWTGGTIKYNDAQFVPYI